MASALTTGIGLTQGYCAEASTPLQIRSMDDSVKAAPGSQNTDEATSTFDSNAAFGAKHTETEHHTQKRPLHLKLPRRFLVMIAVLSTGWLDKGELQAGPRQGGPSGLADRQNSESLAAAGRACLRIVSWEVSSNQPAVHGVVYAEPKGTRLLGVSGVSADNGRTWSPVRFQPDLQDSLPYGYRREPVSSVCDRRTGRLITILNALDTPGLDPSANEPAIAQNTYYLRYRVSNDGGRSWLFDEPIVQTGAYGPKHPVAGVWVGTNSIYLGDAGCIPIVTHKGNVLVPTQMPPLAPDGSLWNPGGGYTFTDVLVLIGTWSKTGHLRWEASQRVRGDPICTTRGLIEPTICEFPDGRILMVMRGSNGGKADPNHELASRKWVSVSSDGGRTWSAAGPWTHDDGQPFFSPSSMSTLFSHSSGRFFWVGNISPNNCKGNLPRWPLVMAEVDPRSLYLIRQTSLVVDSEQPADRLQGRLDISHVTLWEDSQTREIVLTYPRAHHAYESYDWVTARLALNPKGRP